MGSRVSSMTLIRPCVTHPIALTGRYAEESSVYASPRYFQVCKISAVALIKMVCSLFSLRHSWSHLTPSSTRPSMHAQVYHTRSWALCKEKSSDAL